MLRALDSHVGFYSSSSSSESASATYNITKEDSIGLSSTTALTRASTSNTVYYTAAETTGTTYLTRESISGYATRQSVSGYATRQSVSGYGTASWATATYTRASTYETLTRASTYGYSGYTSSTRNYMIDSTAKVYLTYDDGEYKIYNTGAAGYLVVANKNVNFYSRGIPAGSWYNGYGDVQVVWNDGHWGLGYLPPYSSVSIFGTKNGITTDVGVKTAPSSDGMYNVTALTQQSVYGYNTRESIYGYGYGTFTTATYTRASTSATLTRASTSATLTRVSTSGTNYGTRSITTNTEYLTRESTSGYSGVSSSSSSQSASISTWV